MDIQSKKILKAILRFLLVVACCATGLAVGRLIGPRVSIGLMWIFGSVAFVLTKPEKKRAEFEYPPEPPVLNAQQQRRRDDKTLGGD